MTSRICTPCPARPPNRERLQQERTDTGASRQATSGEHAFISKVGRASKLSIKCDETKMSRPRGPAHQLAAHPLLHRIRNLTTSGFPAPDADHQKHVSSFGETLDMARLYIAMWIQVAAERVIGKRSPWTLKQQPVTQQNEPGILKERKANGAALYFHTGPRPSR